MPMCHMQVKSKAQWPLRHHSAREHTGYPSLCVCVLTTEAPSWISLYCTCQEACAGCATFKLAAARPCDATQTTWEAKGMCSSLWLISPGDASRRRATHTHTPKALDFHTRAELGLCQPGKQWPCAESLPCQFHGGGSSEQEG